MINSTAARTDIEFAVTKYSLALLSSITEEYTLYDCNIEGDTIMSKWIDYHGLSFYQPAGLTAYTYTTSHKEIDADGSPRAYHPNDIGLDYLKNAGYPNGGWRSVLVVDPNSPNDAYVQTQGVCAGYFVSKTSLEDDSIAAIDPARYVDAVSIPYIVFPSTFYELAGTGAVGDVLIAKNLDNGQESTAIVADIGPKDAQLGEVSVAFATAMGGTNPNPRNGAGAPVGRIRYVIFPQSRANPKWRRSFTEIDVQARALLTAAGGWKKFDDEYGVTPV